MSQLFVLCRDEKNEITSVRLKEFINKEIAEKEPLYLCLCSLCKTQISIHHSESDVTTYFVLGFLRHWKVTVNLNYIGVYLFRMLVNSFL